MKPATFKLLEITSWTVLMVGGMIFIDPILDQLGVWFPAIFLKS